jgi:hypothetical protein
MNEDSPWSEYPLLRATAVGLAWLGLFSLLYSLGEEVGAWPKPPLGFLRDLDLIVGLITGVGVLVALLRPGRKLRTAN